MLEIDLKGIEGLNALPGKIEAAVEKALDRASGEIVFQAKLRQVQKTYSRQIPKRKNGKAKWKRSGDWINGQEIVKAPRERRIIDTGNAAKPITNYPGGYAEKLATLPVSKDGVARANPAAAEAVRITEPQVQVAFESELRNALT